MSLDARLEALWNQWRQLHDSGQAVSAETLCEQCPELLEQLRARIAAESPLPETVLPERRVTVPDAPRVAPPGYEIVNVLGRGGMGVVYRARQVNLNRLVALKMIRSGDHADVEDRTRFFAEAEAIAGLRHPGIVEVYDFGMHDGLPYYSLELCEGGSLAEQLEGKPLPVRTAVEVVEQVARAVQAAHDAGIVHRDLKPGNVLIQRSTTKHPKDTKDEKKESSLPSLSCVSWLESSVPKITDFGLAKRIECDSGLTQTGAIVGTPSYLSPEQAEGRKDVGPAADTYALGAILYECLTGRPPFVAATVMDTLMQVQKDDPVPPRRLNAQVPVDVETICLKCLQKDPGKRYGSAQALAEDLERWRTGQTILARPASGVERAVKWVRRRPAQAGVVGMMVLVAMGLLAGVALFMWQADEQRRAAQAHVEEVEEVLGQVEEKRQEAVKEKGKAEDLAGKLTRALVDANAKTEKATKAKDEADAERERQAKLLANTNVISALRVWEEGNLRLARQMLAEVPQRFRRWEWRYLHRQFQGSYCILLGHTEEVTSVAFSPDGARLASGSTERLSGKQLPRNQATFSVFFGYLNSG